MWALNTESGMRIPMSKGEIEYEVGRHGLVFLDKKQTICQLMLLLATESDSASSSSV